MIDFEWYRSFLAIYKHNSVTEAAKSRIMTQPALSQHLASLEAEVGEPLFTRAVRKMIPTERGKELYSRLAPLIEALEETTVGLRTASMPAPKVIRIGSPSELYGEMLLPNLKKFGLGTVTYFGHADQCLEDLKEDRVDLILTSKKYLEPGIEYVRYMVENFVAVAPREADVPNVRTLKERENWLSGQDWISYGLELPIIRRYWREHFKKRPQIQPVHMIPNLNLILKAIERGFGLSLLPTYLLQRSPSSAWKTVFEDLTVSNEILIGYKTIRKHVVQEFVNDLLAISEE